MASIYKQLTSNDVASTKTLLHEAIPLTGTIVSGTYGDNNIKNYAHGMFQSVYDYPYLSSSANHIFDITVGYSNNSTLSSSAATHTQNTKKINMYNEMAQVLVGYNVTGGVRQFDKDGDFYGTTADKMKEVIVLPFARLLCKDEIKKGSFELELGVTANWDNANEFVDRVKISDVSGSTSYFVNSPAGEYGVLYATGSTYAASQVVLSANKYFAVGLIYYQAGIAVLSSSIFKSATDGGILNNSIGSTEMNIGQDEIEAILTGSQISSSADDLRHRIYNLQFNNTVELNSTIYFCRANHNEFNYSANPTYLSGSTIRIKTNATDTPISYITTIGLYSTDNQLLAVGKLSEPLRKDPANEITVRARLDY
tara:strand:- start:2284 stop:3387 length:1104 start_codon:yes stop_codon:yes gene_type:complete